ncbi:hypothetical protein OKA05_26975 [Luteolibacter arcticus]|uniref:Uncharacterized protein n=1 Tax=Luteolibacter arcticus TaxID=1581411 RepID=A0ABT3GRT0_9BACT|nr:hypothetical protein [Luteolibacter arcticus]MCW1926230.1 hypothetical protein [Luteolibacter arcticus]
MPKDEQPAEWKFPVDDFRIAEGFICISRSKDLNWEYFDERVDGEIVCTGFRLECAPIRVPGGAYGYKEEITKEPEVMIDVLFPFESLEKLEGTTIPLGEPMENCSRELGSMYLFASHNEVRWQEIRFGKVHGDQIDLELDLLLEVDYDTGVTQFRHTLKGLASIEERWEK